MDVFTAIAARKSVRKYQIKPVAKELVEKIVMAGLQAPSANNVQPWQFVVVTDLQTRKQLAALCDYGKFIAEAPVCIVTFCEDTKYYLEDGSAAVENMHLAAAGLGLGTCWIAGDKKSYARKIAILLAVPAKYKLVALMSLGYEEGESKRKPKRPLSAVLHWEKF